MDPVTYAQKKKVAADLVRFCQRKWLPDTIFDTSELTTPKEKIIEDCLCYLEATKNPFKRQTVNHYLLKLSFYQPEVGAQPLRNCRFELFPGDIATLDAEGLATLKKAVAEHLPHLDTDRYLDLLARVQSDFKKIEASCEAIDAQWESKDPSATLEGRLEAGGAPA